MNWALEITDAPPIYLVASGLACLSTTIGANCTFQPAENVKPKPLNLWILTAGTIAKQRKSTAVNLVRETMSHHFGHFLLAHLGSPEAIYSKIAEQPQCIMVIPEFPSFLAMMNQQYAQALKTILMDLYDGVSTEGRLTRGKGTEKVQDPRVNMIGGAAFSLLERHISDLDFRSGFLSRMLIIAGDRKLRQPDEMQYPVELAKLQADLFAIARWASRLRVIGATADARLALDNLCTQIEDRCEEADQSYEPLLYRSQDHSKKIAALFAASLQQKYVYGSLVEDRVAPLINHSIDVIEKYFIRMMSSSDFVRAAQRIQDWLSESNYKKGDWVPYKAIVQRSLDVRNARLAVEQLVAEEILSNIQKNKDESDEKSTYKLKLLVDPEELLPESQRS